MCTSHIYCSVFSLFIYFFIRHCCHFFLCNMYSLFIKNLNIKRDFFKKLHRQNSFCLISLCKIIMYFVKWNSLHTVYFIGIGNYENLFWWYLGDLWNGAINLCKYIQHSSGMNVFDSIILKTAILSCEKDILKAKTSKYQRESLHVGMYMQTSTLENQ